MECYLIGTKLVLSNSFEEACDFYKKIYPYKCEEYIFGKYGTYKIGEDKIIYVIDKNINYVQRDLYKELVEQGYEKCIKYDSMDVNEEYPLECVGADMKKIMDMLKGKIAIPAIVNEHCTTGFLYIDMENKKLNNKVMK